MSSYGHKTRSPGWQPSNYWVQCQRCAFAIRARDIRKQWDGLIVCPECWEIRHPQDFVRGIKDTIAPQGVYNPETQDQFTEGICSTTNAIAGLGIASCAINGTDDVTGVINNTIPEGTF